jgi:hypothetical protein
MWDLLQTHPAVCQETDGTIRADRPRPVAVLPGSFNPLHHGHTTLAAVAGKNLGLPVAFELSVANVDKPWLTSDELSRRLAQFVGLGPVWVTRAATFVEKTVLFPGAVFVVGFDTAARLVDPKYHRHDPARRDAALRVLRDRECRVVVGGRADATGAFRTWAVDGLAAEFHGLFLPLSEADFRADVSSTALRAGQEYRPAPETERR